MKLFTVYCLLFTCLCAVGCISPTPAMRQNCAAVRDMSERVLAEGVAPAAPLARQLRDSAATVEASMGAPDVRLPVDDAHLSQVDTVRQQADRDARAGGFWTITGSVVLDTVGGLASLAGLTGIGVWIKRLGSRLSEAKAAVDAAEAKAQEYAGHLTVTAGAIDNYLESHPDQRAVLLNFIRAKAAEPPQKRLFDAAIVSVSGPLSPGSPV